MSEAVIVVGGGPAGAVAALVLARAGRSVVVLDAGGSRGARAGETLPAPALPILRDLGLAASFNAQKHMRCAGNVSAWGSPIPHVSDAIANPHGHGWQIDRASFDRMLLAAAQNAGATVLPALLVDVRRSHDGWLVCTNDGTQLRAGWVVDASGRRRSAARRCGANVKRLDRLIAFQVHLEHANTNDLDTRTLVESAPHGWWYTSRVPERGRVVAFLTDRDVTNRAELMRATTFRRKLDETLHIGERVSAYAWHGVRPRGADASSTRLDRVSGDRWIAAGDAAIAFDPLSSQGMFNALYTGLEAGQAVAAALAGDHSRLADYALRIESIHQAYAQHRTNYYGAEARWSEWPFWQRRTFL